MYNIESLPIAVSAQTTCKVWEKVPTKSRVLEIQIISDNLSHLKILDLCIGTYSVRKTVNETFSGEDFREGFKKNLDVRNPQSGEIITLDMKNISETCITFKVIIKLEKIAQTSRGNREELNTLLSIAAEKAKDIGLSSREFTKKALNAFHGK